MFHMQFSGTSPVIWLLSPFRVRRTAEGADVVPLLLLMARLLVVSKITKISVDVRLSMSTRFHVCPSTVPSVIISKAAKVKNTLGKNEFFIK